MSSSLQERPASPPPGRRPPVLPSVEDPVVGGLVGAVGGRPGSHARLGDTRFWTPVRWLVLLTLLTSLLGFWQKSPCRVHPWAEQYQYTRLCYTDVYALYFAERLNEGKTPYLEHPVEYPVVVGAVMQAAATVAEQFPVEERNRRFFDATWGLLTASAVVLTLSLVRLTGRRRVWDAAIFAAAPVLVLHHSSNWDLLAAALAGLALVAWSRRNPVIAGLLLGAATATKVYPALFLVPLLALCWRTRQVGPWVRTTVATAVAVLALVVPTYLVSPSFANVGGTQTQVAGSPLSRLAAEGLSALDRHVVVPNPAAPGATVRGTNAVAVGLDAARERGADWDTVWYALGRARSGDGSWHDRVVGALLDGEQGTGGSSALNRSVLVAFGLLLAGIYVLALRAPRRPRLPQLLFLTVVAYCLTSKVFSPSYALWLLPLALLARPRWRPLLLWQATEAAVLLTRFYFFISNDKPGQGIGYGWFVSAVALRDVALVVLCAFVVRDVLRPARDVVRVDPVSGRPSGDDDPAGGVLDGAPDRSVRQRRGEVLTA